MDEKPFESMNVIPFVDIMLVLLTIVLTTSSFIAAGRIPVRLPLASKNNVQIDQVMTIELTVKGEIFLNDHPVTMGELLNGLSGMKRDSSILIRADRDITLQRFVDIADALKQLGFTRVAVQTKDKTT